MAPKVCFTQRLFHAETRFISRGDAEVGSRRGAEAQRFCRTFRDAEVGSRRGAEAQRFCRAMETQVGSFN